MCKGDCPLYTQFLRFRADFCEAAIGYASMRALVLTAGGTLTLQKVPDPADEQECVIRVTMAGICGTDLQLLEGYAGFSGIPGHEFVGVVERAPADATRWLGKRVVGEINVGCGTCERCRRGVKEHCSERTVVGIRGRSGAFAEYLSLPAANLHEVPDHLDDASAVFAEPVAAACRIFEQVDVGSESKVAVTGDGRLGNLTAQVLRTRTPHVVLFGRHAHKVRIARDIGIDARTDGASGGEAFDVVVEATGRRDGLTQAIEIVKPRGTIVLKSTFHGEAATALWPAVVHEVTIVGSRCGPFAPAIALLASNAVRTAPLVHGTFPLAEHTDAFAAARRELKVLFNLSE
jgi:threonine dehydrogenase-like Zn-dependent dehydrogenase